jgi:hypothetical protein
MTPLAAGIPPVPLDEGPPVLLLSSACPPPVPGGRVLPWRTNSPQPPSCRASRVSSWAQERPALARLRGMVMGAAPSSKEGDQ